MKKADLAKVLKIWGPIKLLISKETIKLWSKKEVNMNRDNKFKESADWIADYKARWSFAVEKAIAKAIGKKPDHFCPHCERK